MAHPTYTTTQTGQERVLKGDRGRRSHPQGERGRLASSHTPNWAATSSSLFSPLTGTPVAARRAQRAGGRNYLLTTAPLSLVSPLQLRPSRVPSTGQSGTRYPPGRKLRPSLPPLHQCHHCQSNSIANAIFTLSAAATRPHKIVVLDYSCSLLTCSPFTTGLFLDLRV